MQENLRENIAGLMPEVTEFEKPFWDCLQNKKVLMVQKCDDCDHIQFPSSPVCSKCLSGAVSWIPCSGKSKLWSKVTFHKKYLEQYSDVPYSVALAKLEEGPMVTGRITNENATAAQFDAPLLIRYIETADGTVLVEFVPE
ncbi:MAG: zinc ribbon domain-containing protein [Oscillospiraceae bacterium]|nr:zinc ribbon domain-containing protein [Oscillospiraceae bacterium]